MIGDAAARGKVKGTTKEQKQYKHGSSYLSVTSSASDGGGDKDGKPAAKRAVKGMKNGPGKPNGPGPKPYEGKHPGKRSGFKTVAPKTEGDSGLSSIDAWCQGKRGSYK